MATLAINPNDVFSVANIKDASINPKKIADVKLEDIEKNINRATSAAELQQAQIMNQPLAMPVITGQAAHMSRLWDAKINALSNMYNTKLNQLAREEEDQQNFIATYGADPKSRPKGMSKKEFMKALQQGKFQDMLTTDFKLKQKQLKGGSGGSKSQSGVLSLLNQAASMREGGREWAAKVAGELYGEEGLNLVNKLTAGTDNWEQAFNPNFVSQKDYEAGVQYWAQQVANGTLMEDVPQEYWQDIQRVIPQAQSSEKIEDAVKNKKWYNPFSWL